MSTRGNGKDVVLQAFHWNLVKTQQTGTIDKGNKSWYKILTDMADRIKKDGFTIVYLPPPWVDDSEWYSNGKHGGGEGYFWRDFDLNSRYGTKTELIKLISVLHERKIKVIVDIVSNHRDGNRMKKDIWEYPGDCWAKCTGRDTGGQFMDGKFDLDLSNPVVYSGFKKALDELTEECGVDGWRWDYVWGYQVEDVKSWIKDTKKKEYFCVGEYWQSSPNMTNDPMIKMYGINEEDRIIGWAKDSGNCAFDIILKRQIQTGNAANLKYGINMKNDPVVRQLVSTFVDNHDMGASPFSPANGWGQQCWPCSPEFKSKAYAFILSTPGTPCVYWPDCYDWGLENEIKDLIHIRKKAGIKADSGWTDLTGQYTGFAGRIKNSKDVETLALSIDSNYEETGLDWEKVLEKKGEWTIWLKKG